MTTLAEYNNNPGNIRPAKGVKYEGLLGVDDKGFGIFQKPEQGQKALIDDLTYKLGKRGIKTPSEFVDIYSPAGEENDEDSRDNYKIYIAQKLGLKSTGDAFPENAVEKLAQAVTKFEGGTWQEKADKKDDESSGKDPEPKEAVAGAKIPPASTEPGSPENTMMGVIGGVTGAGIASSVETGKRILPLIPNIMNRLSGQAPDMDKPVSKVALQNWLNSMLQSNGQSVKLPISELEKLTGKKIRTMGEVGDAYRDIQEIKETKVTKPMVKMVEGRPGVFEQTGRMTSSTVPGRPAIDLTPYETKPTGPIRQAIGSQLQTAGEVAKGALPSVGRVGIGALGGALAGSQLYDAFDQYKKEGEGLHLPSPRNAAKFASGAGGALSMLPFGITQVVGGALQVPELAYQGYDAGKELLRRRRTATKEDTDRMLMNVDPMGNPMP
jgi:hypothetical protein